eukprot:TRINITY_DN65412_c0_g1_i1.p1 TRINITY_DN65412_c0_g1~~TRINITY_DN65412_c0_g1_i1.p1  ORF type:complete len:179 (+),score=30.62 TRINITY_DN65412_c0_g1_i1:135-671(+)
MNYLWCAPCCSSQDLNEQALPRPASCLDDEVAPQKGSGLVSVPMHSGKSWRGSPRPKAAWACSQENPQAADQQLGHRGTLESQISCASAAKANLGTAISEAPESSVAEQVALTEEVSTTVMSQEVLAETVNQEADSDVAEFDPGNLSLESVPARMRQERIQPEVVREFKSGPAWNRRS